MHLGIDSGRLLTVFHPDSAEHYSVNSCLRRLATELADPDRRLQNIQISLFTAFRSEQITAPCPLPRPGLRSIPCLQVRTGHCALLTALSRSQVCPLPSGQNRSPRPAHCPVQVSGLSLAFRSEQITAPRPLPHPGLRSIRCLQVRTGHCALLTALSRSQVCPLPSGQNRSPRPAHCPIQVSGLSAAFRSEQVTAPRSLPYPGLRSVCCLQVSALSQSSAFRGEPVMTLHRARLCSLVVRCLLVSMFMPFVAFWLLPGCSLPLPSCQISPLLVCTAGGK